VFIADISFFINIQRVRADAAWFNINGLTSWAAQLSSTSPSLSFVAPQWDTLIAPILLLVHYL
jgi:hypothetical protein